MKTALRILALLVVSCASLFAQTTGDYRTTGSLAAGGDWGNAANWQRYNGTTWLAAVAAPTGSEAVITIQTGDSININILKTVTGILRNQGKLGSTANLTIGSGGTYEHAQPNGSIPQNATWSTGSTVLVTGYTTGTKPSNSNQSFYNFIWNCPNQTSNVDLAMSGNTIGGDFTVQSTGLSRVYFTSPTSFVSPVTINGNVIVTGGTLSTNGSSSTATLAVTTHGNITVTGGSLGVSRGSAPDATWTLDGDFSVSNAILQNSGAAHVNTLLFSGGHTHHVTLDAVTYGTGSSPFTMEVASGATVDLGTTVVTSSNTGSFIVDAGGTLATAHPSGINGCVQSTGATNGGGNSFNSGANYIFNGSSAQNSGSLLPATVNDLTINNAAGVSLSAPCTVAGTLNLTAGILAAGGNTLQADGSVTRGTGYVTGTLLKPFASAVAKDFEVGTPDAYSPVNVNATGGTGSMSVKAVPGPHPNAADTLAVIPRYWTLTSAGITQADLVFSYPASDVRGTESAYEVARFDGPGFTLLPAVINTTNHTASVTGVTTFSDWTVGEPLALDVKPLPGSQIPKKFFVDENYPNPFNPSTNLRYGVPKASFVHIELYNILGQRIALLFDGRQEAGTYVVRIDGSNLNSGIYFARVKAGDVSTVRRLALTK